MPLRAAREQECTDVNTELDADAIARFLLGTPEPEQVRAWIHSHGSMEAYWSAQDEACIAGMATDSFLLSIVVNKRGDYRCRVDLFQPVRVTLDNVPVRVRVKSPHLAAYCRREFRSKVREVPMQIITLGGKR